MVKKHEKDHRRSRSKNVKADVIILGTNLPGIVTAHKLKKKFGDTMDIMVLDLSKAARQNESKYNVAFQLKDKDEVHLEIDSSAQVLVTNAARQYLTKFAQELNVPLPDAVVAPETIKNPLLKLFQHSNGSAVPCDNNYHDFSYLNFLERFELNQYQNLLDENMRELFLCKLSPAEEERKRLHYYDRTIMENHICDHLLFPTSREVMRFIVRIVCGATSATVSVLFYLHQCYRTNGCKNHLDGANTRVREKLFGYCRKRLKNQLRQSIADITLPVKPIRLIRTYSEEEVVLETTKGETNYVCNLLAMALRPDELNDIDLDSHLVTEKETKCYRSMIPGRAKKFVVNYSDNFWRLDGYSGDIFSMHGPIMWATEKPKLSTTGSQEKYSALVGYLKANSSDDSKEAVIAQLVKLFGDKAAGPVDYKETEIADIYIPHCGDYVAMQDSSTDSSCFRLEWGTLDVFADGDIAAALEAGHTAYLHLLRSLRPQAQTYKDISGSHWRRVLKNMPFRRWLAHLNYNLGARLTVCAIGAFVGISFLREYVRK